MKVMGIDLAGVNTRASGLCILDGHLNAETCLLYADEEILNKVSRVEPEVVSIDAPLALPKGRCCLRDDCECRSRGHLRECDRQLLKMGIKFFPVTLGPMRKLTLRGMKLKKVLEEMDFKVMESYPGAIQDVLGIPRKHMGLNELRKGLIDYGVRGDVEKEDVTDHELDAITSAIAGKLFLSGHYLTIGDPSEILMILPRVEKASLQ